MSLTVNIYYTGKNGNARKFAEEMTSSGLVEQIRGEEGNEKYFRRRTRKRCCSLTAGGIRRPWTYTTKRL